MTAFLMLNCCLPPLSRFTTAPLKGRLKPLLEERWHEVTEWWQKGRRGAVPYEVNAIFGRPMIAPTTPHTQKRPMIAPTNNVCPVFWNLGHCPLRSECGYNLPYKQLSLFSYFNSLILNSPFSYIIYVCGLPPLGIETEPGFMYVKSPISSFARICV